MKSVFNLKIRLLLLISFASFNAGAQENYRPDGIKRLVDHFRYSEHTFTEVELFILNEYGEEVPNLSNNTSFIYNKANYTILLDNKQPLISVDVFIDNNPYELLLVKHEFFNNGIEITNSSEEGVSANQSISAQDLGVHYVGYIKGQEATSIASLSIFDNRVYGQVSSSQLGNVMISKLTESHEDDTHYSFRSTDITHPDLQNRDWTTCSTITEMPETDEQFMQPPHENINEGSEDGYPQAGESTISGGPCVRVFMEMSNDIYDALGQDHARTIQYGVALFAQSATLYLNESILLKLGHLNLWTIPSPYSLVPNTSSDRLKEFQNVWGNIFTEDVAIMIDMGTDGGRAVLNSATSFCDKAKNRMGYAGLSWLGANNNTGFNFNLPIYSWQLNVVTHELGHVFGSAHTHDCVWGSSGNSAIDGCGPLAGWASSPGGCNVSTIPVRGTIMSYCHLTTSHPWIPGIDLSLGFGPLPGGRIRTVLQLVNAMGCIEECVVSCPYSHTFFQHSGPTGNFPFTWNAHHFIQSSAVYTLVPSDHLEYDAGEYISLLPGFETQISGGVFLAHINGCTLDDFNPTTVWGAQKPPKQSLDVNNISTSAIKIYPNPTTGSFHIEIPQQGDYAIRVMNMLGVTVYEGRMADEEKKAIQLDGKLPAGNYTIHISGDGLRHVERVTLIR